MTSMRQVFKKFKTFFLDIFLRLVSLEILLHYPDIDMSHWLREDVQGMMDIVFRENLWVK